MVTGAQAQTRTTGRVECQLDSSSPAKKGFRWKQTRRSHRGRQDPEFKAINQADLETLKLAVQDGHIDLKYLDESGCCLESPVSYSYIRIGEQKRIEQLKSYEECLSILGI